MQKQTKETKDKTKIVEAKCVKAERDKKGK